MSTFDDASLVFIPSGYKTSKAYSVKPSDGSGDLAFTRSNDTATRVNSAGLIEKVRTNVVLRSEEQSNAQYASVINEIASRVAVANPLTGQNNAYKITSTANNDPYIGQVVTGLSNGENTFSLWLWTDSGQALNCDLFFYNQTASEVYAKNITISTTPTRYTHTVNFTSIGANATVRLDLRQTGPTVQYVYTYGWQAESGVATAYIATTSAAVSVGPVANVPRLDYLNSSCPRLLLEPQRTNLVTYSEQFNNAAWTKSNATVTANTSVSPDGYTNADTVVITSGGYLYREITSYSAVSGQSAAISVFAKNQTANFLIFGGATPAGTDVYKIENYGSGWYRHSVVRTFTTTTTGPLQYLIGYEIVGTHIIWGAQIEGSNSAYATSYIPTLGAAVTRGAEKVAKTGITSLIGQTEGTIYFEINKTARTDNQYRFNLSDGSSDNWIFLGIETSNVPRFFVRAAASTGVDFSGSALSSGTHKVAAAYKQNDFVLYVDGVQVGSDTSGNVGGTSQLHFGGNYIDQAAETDSRTAQALLFKTRLSNSELAALTTL